MKNLKLLLMIFAVVGLTNLQGFAQLTADAITVRINKAAKQLEVVKKSDNSNVTASFTLQVANIDIFDGGGEYAGSLELKSWAIPLDEFAPEEIIKVASLKMKENARGSVIELKDIRLTQ